MNKSDWERDFNMSKKREDFSVHLRNLLVSEFKNGISYRKMAEKYKVSKSAVHKICKNILQHNTVENLIGVFLGMELEI